VDAAGGRARFDAEALGADQAAAAQELDRDQAAELGVTGEVDGPPATAPERSDHLVVLDPAAEIGDLDS